MHLQAAEHEFQLGRHQLSGQGLGYSGTAADTVIELGPEAGLFQLVVLDHVIDEGNGDQQGDAADNQQGNYQWGHRYRLANAGLRWSVVP
ncbi:hypothetical protein D3C80_1852940 [compost metagenome]